MFTVELYAAIRRAVMADGLSRREVAKRFGVHRNTITKMLQHSIPPGYRRRERPASKKLGPYMAWIEFPRRFALTSRCVVWDLAEIEAWLAERRRATENAATRRAPHPDVHQRRTRPVKARDQEPAAASKAE